MKMRNLYNNKCPNCNKKLKFKKNNEIIFCKNCNFKISINKMSNSIAEMHRYSNPLKFKTIFTK